MRELWEGVFGDGGGLGGGEAEHLLLEQHEELLGVVGAEMEALGLAAELDGEERLVLAAQVEDAELAVGGPEGDQVLLVVFDLHLGLAAGRRLAEALLVECLEVDHAALIAGDAEADARLGLREAEGLQRLVDAVADDDRVVGDRRLDLFLIERGEVVLADLVEDELAAVAALVVVVDADGGRAVEPGVAERHKSLGRLDVVVRVGGLGLVQVLQPLVL